MHRCAIGRYAAVNFHHNFVDNTRKSLRSGNDGKRGKRGKRAAQSAAPLGIAVIDLHHL